MHSAAVAGRTLPDALRRLDFPRSPGAAARACGVARRAATVERARLHHRVSLLAAGARRYPREGVGSIGTPSEPLLAQHAVSTYYIRRIEQHAGGKTRYQHFLKWLIVVAVDRQIILAQRARQ